MRPGGPTEPSQFRGALAHPRGILVEGEIGRIKGIEDDVEADESILTKPEEALDYVAQTKVDLFAAAVGTSHGVSKGKKMKLRLDLVKEIDDLLTMRVRIQMRPAHT